MAPTSPTRGISLSGTISMLPEGPERLYAFSSSASTTAARQLRKV